MQDQAGNGGGSHQISTTNRTEGDEDRSDTELLGNESCGLQINYNNIVRQKDIYTMYKGQFISGNKNKGAECLVRMSEIDRKCCLHLYYIK